MLVLLHRPPSCIIGSDTNAVHATRPSTLEVMVLLHRPPCCIIGSCTNAVPATRQFTLEVLVLLHRPPSCIMGSDTNVVTASSVASPGHKICMTHSKQGGCSQPLLHALLFQHATRIALLTASRVMQPALAALLAASTSHKNCMTHSKQAVCSQPLLHALLLQDATRAA